MGDIEARPDVIGTGFSLSLVKKNDEDLTKKILLIM
jgi:hypothetical protein